MYIKEFKSVKNVKKNYNLKNADKPASGFP